MAHESNEDDSEIMVSVPESYLKNLWDLAAKGKAAQEREPHLGEVRTESPKPSSKSGASTPTMIEPPAPSSESRAPAQNMIELPESSSESKTTAQNMAEIGFGMDSLVFPSEKPQGPHLENTGKRPIGESPKYLLGGGTRVGTNTDAKTVETLREFTLWSGLGSIALLILLISLTISGALSTALLAGSSVVLLAAAGLFLKIWYDLGN